MNSLSHVELSTDPAAVKPRCAALCALRHLDNLGYLQSSTKELPSRPSAVVSVIDQCVCLEYKVGVFARHGCGAAVERPRWGLPCVSFAT